MRFLYPQKPRHIYDVSVVPQNYFFQIKKNGWRAEIQSDDNSFIIKNRENSKLSRGNPEDWKFLETIFPKPFYLDGELIGTRQAGKLLNHIVIWDAPILGGEDLSKLNYIERYNRLLEFTKKVSHLDPTDVEKFGTWEIKLNNGFGLYLSMNFEQKDFKGIWDTVVKEEIKIRPSLPVNEGIVFKNPNAKNLWDLYKTKVHTNQLKLKTVD